MSHDRQLQQAVSSEVDWEPRATASPSGAAVSESVVTLFRHVDSVAEKQAGESRTSRAKDASAISEEIEARPPCDDDAIATAVTNTLAGDVSVARPHDAVKVMVEKGWVTLTGEVDWHYQRSAAEDDARRSSDVVGVTSNITVKRRAAS
jgi:osmotically-inducible protein OsmY